MDEEARRVGARLPEYLIAWLDAKAKAKGWSFSRAMRTVLREEYERERKLAEKQEKGPYHAAS